MTTTLQSDTLPIELAGERGQPCLAPQGQRGAGERREKAGAERGGGSTAPSALHHEDPTSGRTGTLSLLREAPNSAHGSRTTSTSLHNLTAPHNPGSVSGQGGTAVSTLS